MKINRYFNEECIRALNTHKSEIYRLNYYMAENPELSGYEYEASKRIVDILRNNGIETEYPFAGLNTAFKGTINKGKNIKIAILSEYDALPEIGHGCGHSASGATSVLAALILKELAYSLNAQIDIIGTPDEEVMGGKIDLADKGVFEGYDYAIMLHLFPYNAVFSEMVALDGIKVEFIGKSTHASASPWEGNNALNAAQLMLHAIDMMRQHIKDDIRIHGIIKEGGQAANMVPHHSLLELYTRGLDRAYLDDISEWVKDCAKAAALATRTNVNISALCPSLKTLTRNSVAEKLLNDIYMENGRDVKKSVNLGSSDIGHIDDYCPTFHPLISVGEKDIYLHTTEFADVMKTKEIESVILDGARILVSFIKMTCEDEELLKNIREEYKINRKMK